MRGGLMGKKKIMGNNIGELRFVERSAIFIITGFLSYKFVKNIQIAFLSYSFFSELILMIMWCLIWMGTSSLIRKLLKRSLQEVKMTNIYIEKRRESIKNSKTDEEVYTILNKTYDDGFEDGSNEGL